MSDKQAANDDLLRSVIVEFRGDQDGAIEKISRMHQDNPEDGGVAHAFALMLAQTGKPGAAITVLRRGVAAEFLNPDYYADLANLYHGADDQARTLDCVQSALALSPVDPELQKIAALMSLGGDRSENGVWPPEIYPSGQLDNFDEDGRAITDLLGRREFYQVIAEGRKILSHRPADVRAHYCLGVALQSYNHVGQVIHHLTQVAASMPAFAGARKGLGDFLHQAWRLKSIRGEFADAVLEYPGENNRMSELNEAAGSYRAALYHQPEDARTRLYYGNLLNDMGDAAGAIEQYHLAVRLAPGWVSAQYNLAEAMGNAGELGHALDRVELVLAAEPEFREALALKAKLLALNGDCIGAGMSDMAAIDLAPKFSTEAYF
jgi:tetratricopeptide (TPR) repeat protein